MRISVIGAGYVGLSNALLLSKLNTVNLIDINEEKILCLKSKKSPINDPLIKKYLAKKNLSINFNTKIENLDSTDIVLVATPTNFNSRKKNFDTASIEQVLDELKRKKFSKLVVIRSTVPIGFTEKMQKEFTKFDIAFFPEFLREGCALKDNLYPTRIICGSKSKAAKKFLHTLKNCAIKKNIDMKITNPSEAEAIKLFSNTYLAMRISFFNELDTFAISKNLDSKNIIEGVSLDPRIGNFYNNPSFGYGGYCLPKDTRQLKQNYLDIPQKLINGTIQSNKFRKDFIVSKILETGISEIGIYRLSMKAGSDNWRESAVIDVMKKLKKNGKKIFIYEPLISAETFMGNKVVNNLKNFKQYSKLILANRLDEKIESTKKILFTRDIFREN